jgi:hypothetical protein
MHGESQPIPSLDDEDLDIDLSQGKKKTKRDAVVPAGYQKSKTGANLPGRTKVGGTTEKPSATKAKKGLRQWAPSAKAASNDE